MQTPLGPTQRVLIKGCPYFRGCLIYIGYFRDHMQCPHCSVCPYFKGVHKAGFHCIIKYSQLLVKNLKIAIRFLTNNYRIVGNFWIVQIFAYFKHIQIARKLGPTCTKFWLVIMRLPYSFLHGNFHLLQHSTYPSKYGSLISWPWWWKEHAPWVEKFELTRVFQRVWFQGPGKFQNFNSLF